MVFSSAYQFCQVGETDDHYFKGWPSYWNIVALYLFCWVGALGELHGHRDLRVRVLPVKYSTRRAQRFPASRWRFTALWVSMIQRCASRPTVGYRHHYVGYYGGERLSPCATRTR